MAVKEGNRDDKKIIKDANFEKRRENCKRKGNACCHKRSEKKSEKVRE
jgi:hypothetical protein